MSWEHTPRSPWLRRGRWPAIAVAVVAAVAAIVFAIATVRGGDPRDAGTLTMQPGEGSVETARALPSAAPTDLEGGPLDPLEIATETPGDRPLLPAAPDITIVTADDRRVRTIDVATGDVRHLGLDGRLSLGLEPQSMFEVGDNIIGTEGGDVVLIEGNSRQRRRLARNHWALPTMSETTVWVVDDQQGPQTVAQLRLDGTIIDRVTLPAVALAQVGIDDGVLVSSAGGVHQVAGDGVRQITTSGQLAAVGANGHFAWFVCAADLTCELVLGTLDDPDQQRLPLAANELPGVWYSLELGHFSPDGRWLALPVYSFGEGSPPMVSATSIIDTASGAEAARIDEQAWQPFDPVAVAWSPDSRWLFIGLDDGLAAWDARSGELTPLDDHTRPLMAVSDYTWLTVLQDR